MELVVLELQGKFDAVGDPQLVEDARKTALDGVFAKIQLAGNLAIGQALRHERCDLLLAFAQHRRIQVQCPQRSAVVSASRINCSSVLPAQACP